MYSAVQPRLVTEFVYRHTPQKQKALIYMSVERAEEAPRKEHDDESRQVIQALKEINVEAMDITVALAC